MNPIFRWLLVSTIISVGLFIPFATFSTIRQAVGWSMLGFIASTGVFGFVHCLSSTSRNPGWSHSFGSDYGGAGGDTLD